MSSEEEFETVEISDCEWSSGKTLIEHLLFMYENQLGVDFEITVVSGDNKQKTFKCHKLIVRRLTPNFLANLNEPGDASRSLSIENLDPDIFAEILRFAYTEKLNVEDIQDVLAVYEFANLYKMDVVKRQCYKLFLVKMNNNNVWDILTFMEKQPPDVDLERCLSSFLSTSGTCFLNAPKFLNCSLKVLEFILSQEELLVAEGDLAESVIRWAKHKHPELTPEKSKELLGPCLGKIRFLCMTSSEFCEVVALSGLLLQEDCFSILINIVSGNQAMPLPDYICKLATPRMSLEYMELDTDSSTPSSEKQQESPKFSPKVEPSAAPVETNPTAEVESKKAESTSKKPDFLLVRRAADPKCEPKIFSVIKEQGLIEVNIEVSKTVGIKGVRITSQLTPAECEPGNYEEDMYVKLLMTVANKKKSQCAYMAFTQNAPNGQNKHFDVMFKKPFSLEANKEYILQLVFRKPGTYMFHTRPSSISVDGCQVKFKVDGSKKTTHGADPIEALFFKFN
ncbi:Hypothetical predicted protein [Cloeon dipterum]|uniref:BTB domain-containing protein n=1 Tax=Cloeon dipterum TaxID=197152 RepID=A0A8S1CZG1_9INSE|nr:Hypothetical predicted protein [Cloeon dipterum]